MKRLSIALLLSLLLFGFAGASDETHKFGTLLNCIDGRTQLPLIQKIKKDYHVDYVDDITSPGMDKEISEGSSDFLDRIKSSVLISVRKHHSNVVAIAGHYDCAANPVSEAEHKKQIQRSIAIIKSWNLPVTVVGFWVDRHWQANAVPAAH